MPTLGELLLGWMCGQITFLMRLLHAVIWVRMSLE